MKYFSIYLAKEDFFENYDMLIKIKENLNKWSSIHRLEYSKW